MAGLGVAQPIALALIFLNAAEYRLDEATDYINAHERVMQIDRGGS